MCAIFARQRFGRYTNNCSQKGEAVPGTFKAHRLVYHSTLGWRVTEKKKVRKVNDLLDVSEEFATCKVFHDLRKPPPPRYIQVLGFRVRGVIFGFRV
jgi:hypothetical protein